jgi:hypothetical protein
VSIVGNEIDDCHGGEVIWNENMNDFGNENKIWSVMGSESVKQI